mmetsp:Transcript_96819/g.273610  ORF Transcript_96819/g.273610 Transcript_96819/m.273610 type:complete len:551 (-) Transcript_96819:70-1722(-)
MASSIHRQAVSLHRRRVWQLSAAAFCALIPPPAVALPRETASRLRHWGSDAKALLEPLVPHGGNAIVGNVSATLLGTVVFRDDADKAKETWSPLGATGTRIISLVVGGLVLCLAVAAQWMNERRSVRIETLISRGLAECKTVSSKGVDKENRGRLVHVQGKATAEPIKDSVFMGAQVEGCLKLQSTVEVLENVPTLFKVSGTYVPQFHEEWTPFHATLKEFRNTNAEIPHPPINPEPPRNFVLGTSNSTSSRVTIGDFVLPDSLVARFSRFVPAMSLLPDVLYVDDMTFHANRSDGFYYARPTSRGSRHALRISTCFSGDDVTQNHCVGDLRARFLCVPDGDATVVGVQCCSGGDETFVPFRALALGCCPSEADNRKRLAAEGSISLKEFLGQDVGLCLQGDKGQPMVPCCACCYPCTTIACFCNLEVVTEEILYVSDRIDPLEKAFEQVVPRNKMRVLCYRLLAWGAMYAGLGLVLRPFAGQLVVALHFDTFADSHAVMLMLFMATAMLSALVMASAYAHYLPNVALQYILMAGFVACAPFIGGRLSHA